jgi:hypothetical protein
MKSPSLLRSLAALALVLGAGLPPAAAQGFASRAPIHYGQFQQRQPGLVQAVAQQGHLRRQMQQQQAALLYQQQLVLSTRQQQLRQPASAALVRRPPTVALTRPPMPVRPPQTSLAAGVRRPDVVARTQTRAQLVSLQPSHGFRWQEAMLYRQGSFSSHKPSVPASQSPTAPPVGSGLARPTPANVVLNQTPGSGSAQPQAPVRPTLAPPRSQTEVFLQVTITSDCCCGKGMPANPGVVAKAPGQPLPGAPLALPPGLVPAIPGAPNFPQAPARPFPGPLARPGPGLPVPFLAMPPVLQPLPTPVPMPVNPTMPVIVQNPVLIPVPLVQPPLEIPIGVPDGSMPLPQPVIPQQVPNIGLVEDQPAGPNPLPGLARPGDNPLPRTSELLDLLPLQQGSHAEPMPNPIPGTVTRPVVPPPSSSPAGLATPPALRLPDTVLRLPS